MRLCNARITTRTYPPLVTLFTDPLSFCSALAYQVGFESRSSIRARNWEGEYNGI
jgi:hypothetical protein